MPRDTPHAGIAGIFRSSLAAGRAPRAFEDGAHPTLSPEVTGEWRGGDVRHVLASSERAGSQLGLRAVEDFEAGMREFAEAKLRA
jgi:dTDP-L-rhamnose 4-epimerase